MGRGQIGRDQIDGGHMARGWPWVIASATILIAMLAIIAYAWIDGGRVPLRTIVEPVSPQVGNGAGH
jgi:hypothetical protein